MLVDGKGEGQQEEAKQSVHEGILARATEGKIAGRAHRWGDMRNHVGEREKLSAVAWITRSTRFLANRKLSANGR